MNDYNFDYMNYITNIPTGIKYNQINKMNMNYNMAKSNMINLDAKTSDTLEGWLKGNLFPNTYDSYKNYKYVKVEPKNEKEALLYQIMQYKFALIDLNLYLDTNPNDLEKIKLYSQYLNIEKQMCDKYESMYGPLMLDSNYLDKNKWVWADSSWPWEVI